MDNSTEPLVWTRVSDSEWSGRGSRGGGASAQLLLTPCTGWRWMAWVSGRDIGNGLVDDSVDAAKRAAQEAVNAARQRFSPFNEGSTPTLIARVAELERLVRELRETVGIPNGEV